MSEEIEDDPFYFEDEEENDEPNCYCCYCCGWVGGKKPIWNQCPKCDTIVEPEFI